MQKTVFNGHFLSLHLILSIFSIQFIVLCGTELKKGSNIRISISIQLDWLTKYSCSQRWRKFADTLNKKNTVHPTRKTACSLPQRSRFLGPGRSHQELRSPGSTPTVTSRLSAAHPALRPASRETISLSRAGPYHWKPGWWEKRGRRWSSGICGVSEACVHIHVAAPAQNCSLFPSGSDPGTGLWIFKMTTVCNLYKKMSFLCCM